MSGTEILLLIGLSTLGYGLFYLLSIPTPAFLGPLILIYGASFLGFQGDPLSGTTVLLLQSLLGANIGVKVTREIFQQMKALKIPSLIMIGWTLFLSFGLGLLLMMAFDLDVATALLSATPSGVSEMGILALALGGNAGIVIIFQLSRLMIAIVTFPIIVEKLTEKDKNQRKKQAWWEKIKGRGSEISHGLKKSLSFQWPGIEIFSYFTTVGIGIAGALLGTWMNIPAGALMGAFFLTGSSVIAGIPLKAPTPFMRIVMQMGIAIMLALNIMNSPMESMKVMLLPTFGFSAIIFIGVYFLYHLLRKVTQWDPVTCLLAAAPVGLTPMSILAYEYAEKPMEVVLLHMTRVLVGKLIVIPVIIFLLV
ncbi:AbrB family transcriptional regulator [Tindallia californiensis]|uniref:Membrane protein AbrB duplication n=1 Tax=Tindallia californiensis TaxID=159292 RepID=A0A1H3PVY3_9FIRM|nr:AbrB family transcriptional regulator [Tindallia californiensis]SDZ05098.1 hypothetical protein SAMN05192546_107126 [Tindallia californiensis]